MCKQVAHVNSSQTKMNKKKSSKLKALLEFVEPTTYCCCQSMCINIGVIVISVKNALTDPVTLTFEPQNHHF